MSVFTALNTAVSGIRAQSVALSHISDNVANSRTVGFKRIDTQFSDLVTAAGGADVGVGSVRSTGRITTNAQGGFISSEYGTHAAINGEGFFSVARPSRFANGVPQFDGGAAYTRRGDFAINDDGYLVNGAGYYLRGRDLIIGSSGASVSSGGVASIRVSSEPLPARGTTQIEFSANLPAVPVTANYRSDTAGSELLDPTSFAASPLVGGAGTVIADDEGEFVDSSVPGGSIDIFTPSGERIPLTLRWAKVDSASTGTADTWNAWYLTNGNAEDTDVAWVNLGQNFSFAGNGSLSPELTRVNVDEITINGQLIGDVELRINNSVTQYSDSTGSVRVNALSQNGYSSSEILDISISNDGRVNAKYSNGSILPVAEVAIANFPAPNALQRADGGAFVETVESGTPTEIVGAALAGSSLESSNTDIGTEFTKLIVTQQAYSAGARVISIGDEMLETAINITG